MKASVLTEYGRIEWKEKEKPQCDPDKVLIKVAYGCICGSDQHIYKGEFVPRTTTPMVMGHEFGGTVAEVGSEVTGWEVGDKVAPDPIIPCMECPACKIGHYPACTSLKIIGVDLDGGFQQYIQLPPHMLYKVPASIPDKYIALIEVMGVACHAKNRAELKKDDTVVIWGAGKVGLCVLQAVRTVTDNTVFLVDVLPERLALAPEYYDNIVTIDATKEDPVKVIKEKTDGKGVDVAFEVVGHSHGVPGQVEPVRGCVQSIRGAGTVCVLGLSAETTPILFKELIWKEAKIVASRVSHGEFAEVIDHLVNNRLKLDMIITDILDGSKAQEAFDILEEDPANNVKILLDFSGK